MFRKNYFRLLAWFFPSEKDLVKNKYAILTLLFTCDHQSISSKETIQLINSVIEEVDTELKKRYTNHHVEIEAIDTYFKNKQQS